MSLLRLALFVFAMANAAAWAGLACAWRFRPDWSERLPWQLGTHERYRKAAPVWARLALALTVFWALAAGLYLSAGLQTLPFLVVTLFTAAAACLILAIGAAAAVYRALQPEPLPTVPDAGQQAL
jgi:hypothetical protein